MKTLLALILSLGVLLYQAAEAGEAVSFEEAVHRMRTYYEINPNVAFSVNTVVTDSSGSIYYKDSVYVVKSEPYFYYVNGGTRLYYGPEVYLSVDDENEMMRVLNPSDLADNGIPAPTAFFEQISQYIDTIWSATLADGNIEYTVLLEGYPYYSGFRSVFEAGSYRAVYLGLDYPAGSALGRTEVYMPFWNAAEVEDLSMIRRKLIHLGTEGQHRPGVCCPGYSIINLFKEK